MGRNQHSIDSEDQPGFTWFKFYPIDWLSDPNVLAMTSAERGVYIDLLCVQWRDNGLPVECKLAAKLLQTDSRTVAKWFQKWGDLFPVCESLGKRANRKLLQLAEKAGRLAIGKNIDKNKNKEDGEEIRFIPPHGGNKTLSPDHDDLRWPGEPDPDCSLCGGTGNTVVGEQVIGCRCIAETP